MADEYIRKADAVNIAESYEVKRDGFHLNDYEYGRNQVADSIASDLEDMPPADVVPVNREKVMSALRKYFSIGDSYTYELTRVKSATISLYDFEEWGEKNISDLCDYIFQELRKESEHG